MIHWSVFISAKQNRALQLVRPGYRTWDSQNTQIADKFQSESLFRWKSLEKDFARNAEHYARKKGFCYLNRQVWSSFHVTIPRQGKLTKNSKYRKQLNHRVLSQKKTKHKRFWPKPQDSNLEYRVSLLCQWRPWAIFTPIFEDTLLKMTKIEQKSRKSFD